MNTATVIMEDAIRNGILPELETFSCPYNAKTIASGVIRIIFPEFTCVCPRTGYPDFAAMSVYYLPDALCLELKSWKLYLNAFRMVGAFHEAVTAHLFDALKRAIAPQWLLVIGDFFPRGNVDTTLVFETPGPRPSGVDLLIAPPLARCRGFDSH